MAIYFMPFCVHYMKEENRHGVQTSSLHILPHQEVAPISLWL